MALSAYEYDMCMRKCAPTLTLTLISNLRVHSHQILGQKVSDNVQKSSNFNLNSFSMQSPP